MNTKDNNDINVAVAMSGGVDSSVAAALLVKQGFKVTGFTMQLMPPGIIESTSNPVCCGLSGVEDAKRVCREIGIPHYVLNLRDEFQEKIIDNFISEYKMGRTPNPCVDCNRYLKFDILLQKIQQLGFEYLATGHYATTVFNLLASKPELHCGYDKNKNQAYFLYPVSAKNLKSILFPVGFMTKVRIRQIAEQYNLPVAQKKGSMDICFIPQNNYREFLKNFAGITEQDGDIIHLDGTVMGRHNGITNYTIGQRKGLGIGHTAPLYVYELNTTTNSVIVGEVNQQNFSLISVDDFHLINTDEDIVQKEYDVKLRYKSSTLKGTVLTHDNKNVVVKLLEKENFVAPGQSLVLFQGTRVVGGGNIKKAME